MMRGIVGVASRFLGYARNDIIEVRGNDGMMRCSKGWGSWGRVVRAGLIWYGIL